MSCGSGGAGGGPRRGECFFPGARRPLVSRRAFRLTRGQVTAQRHPAGISRVSLFSKLLFYKSYNCGVCTMHKTKALRQGRTCAYNGCHGQTEGSVLYAARCVHGDMLGRLILTSLRQMASCIGRRRRRFVRATGRYDTGTMRGALARRQGRLSGTRGHVGRLGVLFHGLCRSGTLKGLSSRRFTFLASNCSRRGGALAQEVTRLSRRVSGTARHDTSMGEFITLMHECATVRRLACRGIRRFVSHVLVRRLSGRAGAHGVRVFCDFINEISANSGPARDVSCFERVKTSMGDCTVWRASGENGVAPSTGGMSLSCLGGKNTTVPFGVIQGSVAEMGTSMVIGATGPGPVYTDNASLTVCRTTKGRGLLTRETGVNGVTENSVTIANTCDLGTGCVVRAMNPM